MYMNYYIKLCKIFYYNYFNNFYINLNIKYHKIFLTIKLVLVSLNEPVRLAR
jgi:hypothetical protein